MSCSSTIWILFMGVVEVILRLTDGSIPAPPFDLVITRAEQYTFRDTSTSCVPRFSTKTYHEYLRLVCGLSLQ